MSLVYLIDDEPSCLDSMQTLISVFGYECRAYADAESFLATFDENVDGIVLADYRMPTINGQLLFEKVRERNASIPFVLISGHADEELVDRMIKSGVTSFLCKPVKANVLQQAIAQAFSNPVSRTVE